MKLHRYLTAAERFEAQSTPVPESGCWLWLGTLVKGYGQFSVNGERQLAHRYALSQRLGRDLLPGAMACHKCDTPACVNPDHLYEGTLLENVRDAVVRGRCLRGDSLASTFRTRCRGAAHHSNKLTEQEVRAIRVSSLTTKALAKAYGVSSNTARKIKHHLIWKHVDGGATT